MSVSGTPKARAPEWSEPARWEMGLLQPGDWGNARWIDYPGRTETQPLPIFARKFDVHRKVAKPGCTCRGSASTWPRSTARS